jgi:serine/threonine-protein kinase
LGSALRALHQQGLIHRDIKPENLFIRSSGSLVLMDFGIALAQDLTRATQTGMTVGTPSYMAPEQLRGHVEPSSDQYAAGLVAFECLTGKRAFEGDDPMQVAYQQVHSPPPPPGSLHSEISGRVDAVVLKMLEKSPQHRYPSVEAACKALEDALQGREAELDQDTRETSF